MRHRILLLETVYELRRKQARNYGGGPRGPGGPGGPGGLGGPDPCPSSQKAKVPLSQGNAKLPFGNEMIRYYCQY